MYLNPQWILPGEGATVSTEGGGGLSRTIVSLFTLDLGIAVNHYKSAGCII